MKALALQTSFTFFLGSLLPASLHAESVGPITESPLEAFVKKAEPAFAWSITERKENGGFTSLSVKLTSQTWQGKPWQHDVRIFRPKPCLHPSSAILFINGGSNGREPNQGIEAASVALAGMSGMPVVAVFQVPNQPLLGGKYEDELIAATWLKYLDTEDATWPLLFPMVKSAVQTMNAADALSRKEFGQPIESFVVTGASKRGWTSWLSAAAVDRVVGIAPMVIDTLNFRKQMRDQKEKWGDFSEQIADYTEAGLINLENETPREKQLRVMMDPYEYRDQIDVPKLLIHGSNDRYWRCDAMDNYWPDLTSPKNVLTIANAGHSLEGGHLRVTAAIANFAQRCVDGRRLPEVDWSVELEKDERFLVFEAIADQPVSKFTFWVASSPSRDFRDAKFEARTPTAKRADRAKLRVDVPTGRHVAVFADLTFGSLLTSFDLSTGIAQPNF